MVQQRSILVVKVLLILRCGDARREEIVVIGGERCHCNDLAVLRVHARHHTLPIARRLHPPAERIKCPLLCFRINRQHHTLSSNWKFGDAEFAHLSPLGINFNLANAWRPAQHLFIALLYSCATDVIQFVVSRCSECTQLERINATNVSNNLTRQLSEWVRTSCLKDRLNTRQRGPFLFNESCDAFVNDTCNAHRLPNGSSGAIECHRDSNGINTENLCKSRHNLWPNGER